MDERFSASRPISIVDAHITYMLLPCVVDLLECSAPKWSFISNASIYWIANNKSISVSVHCDELFSVLNKTMYMLAFPISSHQMYCPVAEHLKYTWYKKHCPLSVFHWIHFVINDNWLIKLANKVRLSSCCCVLNSHKTTVEHANSTDQQSCLNISAKCVSSF